MEAPPLIVLYTSDEHVEESNKLRSLIKQTGFSYEEQNINAEDHVEMIGRYGGQVQVPGIQVDNLWIAEHEENIAEFIGNYWLDKLLATTADPSASNHRSDRRSPRRASIPDCLPIPAVDIEFDPSVGVVQSGESRIAVKSRTLLVSTSPPDDGATHADIEEWSYFTDPTFALPSVVSTESPPVDPTSDTPAPELPRSIPPLTPPPVEDKSPERYINEPIRLPSGSEVSVGSVQRLLLGVMKHQCLETGNERHYYFHGEDGIKVWKGLFFDREIIGRTDDEVIDFGRTLIERGLVHNYSADEQDLRKAFLVLQPLQEPRLLNTFINIPRNKGIKADPVKVIMNLSLEIDALCGLAGDVTHEFVERFHKFEENVCQLQAVHFPTDAVNKVTFGLNLFNLIARHAMLLRNEMLARRVGWSRPWSATWPNGLEQVDNFMRTVCYFVGGRPYSLASLRNSLYGQLEGAASLVKHDMPKWWRQMLCRGVDGEGAADVHFAAPLIQNGDPRIIFAMTWGTQSSPVVSTIHPDRLGVGLQAHAELYLQQHVHVGSGQVILPPMLSWHREDFGTRPGQVLLNIIRYLSVDQRARLRALQERGRVDIVFSQDYNWDSGLPTSPPRREASVLPRQHNLLGAHGSLQDAGVAGLSQEVTSSHPMQGRLEQPTPVAPILLNPASPIVMNGWSDDRSRSSKSSFSLRSLLGRPRGQTPSKGDSKPYMAAGLGATDFDDEYCDVVGGTDFEDDYCGDSVLYNSDEEDENPKTTISEMTVGSEFEDLVLRSRANRRRMRG